MFAWPPQIKSGLDSFLAKWSGLVVSDSATAWTWSPPGSSVHGIFQARILGWVAISFARRSSRPRDRTQVSRIVGRRFACGNHLFSISTPLPTPLYHFSLFSLMDLPPPLSPILMSWPFTSCYQHFTTQLFEIVISFWFLLVYYIQLFPMWTHRKHYFLFVMFKGLPRWR